MKDSAKKFNLCIISGGECLFDSGKPSKRNASFVNTLTAMSGVIDASRESTLLGKWSAPISAILSLREKPQVLPPIIPRVVIDMINHLVNRDIKPHQGIGEPMGGVEDAFRGPSVSILSIRGPLTDADLNCRPMITPLPALLGASLLASEVRIPHSGLMRADEVMIRPLLPSQNPSVWIVFKALLEKSLGKLIDVLDRLSRLTRNWATVLSDRLVHIREMWAEFRSLVQPNTGWGFVISSANGY